MTRYILGFADAEGVARYAAAEFVRRAKQAVWDRGVFRVALAGGSTPRRTYELLASREFASKVEWTSVQIFFGDERAVAPDDPASNFQMVHKALLHAVPLHTSQVHRMAAERFDLAGAARDYQAQLSRSFALKVGDGFPSFDLVLLGMGKDGHTASLFPFTQALSERNAWVAANEVPRLGTMRLTLTVPVLNAASALLFLVTGHDKAEAVERVLEGSRDGFEFPSQLIAPSGGDLFWLLDNAAAARLTQPPLDPSRPIPGLPPSP